MPDHSKTTAAGTAARDAAIFGLPARIPPLAPEDFTPEVHALTAELQKAAGVPLDGYVPDYIATVLRYPTLYRSHSDLALFLMANGALSARDRELAVLRTGWLCRAPFEWNAHVEMGKRVAGITDAEIEWVIIGAAAPGWGAHDRAIIRAVEELFEDAMITDETWAVLAAGLDERQLMELPVLVAQYMGVAFLQNSLRVKLMPGYVGLSAR
jgi:alkylhydroperoxidase family enzyme